jgi:hypothetical protein
LSTETRKQVFYAEWLIAIHYIKVGGRVQKVTFRSKTCQQYTKYHAQLKECLLENTELEH